MYILNERELIEKIISTREQPIDIGNKYLITMLAKYYYSHSISSDELYNKVLNELKNINVDNPYFQEYKWFKFINNVSKALCSGELSPNFKIVDGIPIYQSEIDYISSFDDVVTQKLMFTMIVLARYMNCDGWINKKNIKAYNELFKLANLTANNSKKYGIIHQLYIDGHIELARANDNLNIKVNLAEPGNVAYWVTKFENLGNQYVGHFKDGWSQCECCGRTIKVKKGVRPKKYCSNCAKKVDNEKAKMRFKSLYYA